MGRKLMPICLQIHKTSPSCARADALPLLIHRSLSMKNRAIEAMKQRAKLYHHNEIGDQFTNGIIVRHLYHDMTPECSKREND